MSSGDRGPGGTGPGSGSRGGGSPGSGSPRGDGLGSALAFSARLLRRRWLSASVFEVELERPADFLFRAGQSIRVFVGEPGRDYSLASGPGADFLSLCVRLVESGVVSPFLARAAPGVPVRFTGPHGVFTLMTPERPVVWAATGVGIAPFLAMVRAGATGFTLLHGVRRSGELFYRKELEASAARYVPCLSREPGAGFAGRVTDWAAENIPPGAYDIFLCGNRGMVRDFMRIVDERFPRSRVFTEIFY